MSGNCKHCGGVLGHSRVCPEFVEPMVKHAPPAPDDTHDPTFAEVREAIAEILAREFFIEASLRVGLITSDALRERIVATRLQRRPLKPPRELTPYEKRIAPILAENVQRARDGRGLLGLPGTTYSERAACWCERCRPLTLSDMRMITCPDCHNKRCPRAAWHGYKCTGSNEPGQKGEPA